MEVRRPSFLCHGEHGSAKISSVLRLFGLLLLFQVCAGLKIVDFQVPSAVIQGEGVWLNCTYDLEQEQLNSIKWFKNGVEFYRYLPSENPPAQKFPTRGVQVEMLKSNLGKVYLPSTLLTTEGVYRCEVSADAPMFHTVREEKRLKIVALPAKGPTLTSNTSPPYKNGDFINITCSFGPSKPPANLHWYINEIPAGEDSLRHFPPVKVDQLHHSRLDLLFTVGSHHFRNGVLQLGCTAIVSQEYSMSAEEIIMSDKPFQSEHIAAAVGSSDGPTISGGKSHYNLGEMVNVNCITSRFLPNAELRWFVNDLQADPNWLIHSSASANGSPSPGAESLSSLGLKFRLEPNHFRDNMIRLKCTATHSQVIRKSSQEAVFSNNQRTSGLHISENSRAVRNKGAVSTSSRYLGLFSTFFLLFLIPVSKNLL